MAAWQHDRLDEAERLCEDLATIAPGDAVFTFRVLILIRRGRVLDALHAVHERGEGRFPELKAVCLHLLRDPCWHSLAEPLLDADDPHVRGAMRQLLQREA